MAPTNPLTISSMAVLFMFLVLLPSKVPSQQDGISFDVTTFTANHAWLTYQGDAKPASDSSYLRLTRTSTGSRGPIPTAWSVGRVVFSTAIQFWESSPAPRQASFQTNFTFNVRASANGAAEGLAFFIAPVGSTAPLRSSGANLGIFGSTGRTPNLFAVEFDNYVNSAWDPAFPHIGIDLEVRKSKASTRFVDRAALVRDGLVTAVISYDATTRRVTVDAAVGSRSFRLTYITDLKEVLPQRVQVGISSATGQNVNELGIYDLLSWSFVSNLVSD